MKIIQKRALLFVKSTVFLLVAPGTVIVYFPDWIRHSAGEQSIAPRPFLVPILAFFGAVFGLLLLRSIFDFAVTGDGTPAPIDPPKTLVVQGPYRFTRNPMYVGVIGLNLVRTLWLGSRVLAIYTPLVWLLFHLFVVFVEERSLRRRFGDAYDRYCLSVPRWWFRLTPYEPAS